MPVLFGCIAIAVHGVKWIISTWIRATASIPARNRLSFIADPKIPPVKILLEADEDEFKVIVAVALAEQA